MACAFVHALTVAEMPPRKCAAQAAQAAWAASVALEGGAVTLLLDCHHGRRTASCKAGAGRERVGLPQLHDRRRQPHGRRREYAPPHGAACAIVACRRLKGGKKGTRYYLQPQPQRYLEYMLRWLQCICACAFAPPIFGT